MYGLERYEDLVEPNVHQEPRPAVAPFVLFNMSTGRPWRGAFGTRAEAEETARERCNETGHVFIVMGSVSISSRPQPVKASTRALV